MDFLQFTYLKMLSVSGFHSNCLFAITVKKVNENQSDYENMLFFFCFPTSVEVNFC